MIQCHSSECIPYSGKFFLEKHPTNFPPLATPDVDYGRVNLTLGVSLRDSDVGETCFNLTIEDDMVVEAMECLVLVFQRMPQIWWRLLQEMKALYAASWMMMVSDVNPS